MNIITSMLCHILKILNLDSVRLPFQALRDTKFAIRLEAIATRLEAIASRVRVGWRPSIVGEALAILTIRFLKTAFLMSRLP